MDAPTTTVFIADDDPSILNGIELTLRQHGYGTRMARCGASMLRLLHESAEAPDLILLDVTMPSMSGLDVFRTIRAQHRSSAVPVLFISAQTDCNLAEDADAVQFLHKPFRARQLLNCVSATVAGRGGDAL